jgi:hypothetical protein
MSGSVQISGTLSAIPIGVVDIGPLTITANVSNLTSSIEIAFASGANTITVPNWSVGVLIIPATTNVIAMTLKGVTGDTGIALSLTAPSLLAFPATAPGSFVITSASANSTATTIWFF